MDFPGVELAGLVGLHQLGCVIERRRPVEPAAERLANDTVELVKACEACQFHTK